ncbi:MAG: 5'-nucleotidase C-terminal domain-containing protein [Chitinophagaceae bacterium]|nr:5'-nucleotidase C-terminal domain-containing protein [Chitinophagaceae bacterium]
MNYGGIRLPAIPAGNITRGKIFELAPFDNIIVLQKISGKTFQAFFKSYFGPRWLANSRCNLANKKQKSNEYINWRCAN